MTDTHARVLTQAGQLKMRAAALKLFGDDDSRFEAAVLFHDAVREERRALWMLPEPTPAQVLTTEIETCWLLLEGLDPQGAVAMQPRLQQAAAAVPDATRLAMLARLQPRILREASSYTAAFKRFPTLFGAAPPDGDAARKQVEEGVRKYPGVAHFWLIRGTLLSQRGDPREAFRSIERAQRLEPEMPGYFAAGLAIAPLALSLSELDAFLSRARARLPKEASPVDLVYCIAELYAIHHGRQSDANERLGEIERRLLSFIATAPPGGTAAAKSLLSFVSLVRAGGLATTEALRNAGLGRMVDAAPLAIRDDPMRVLMTQAQAFAAAA